MSLESEHPALFQLGFAPHDCKFSRSSYRGTSLQLMQEMFPTEETVLRHICRVRFGEEPVCDRCHSKDKWYWLRGRRHFLHPCGRTLSPMAGTLFHGTKLPLRLWLYTMLHFANSPQGVNGRFLSRHLGIGRTATSRIVERIRLHFAALDKNKKLESPSQRLFVRLASIRRVYASPPNPKKSVPVFLMSDGRAVQSTVLQFSRPRHLRMAIKNKAAPNSKPLTTCFRTFRLLSSYNMKTSSVDLIPKFVSDAPDDFDPTVSFLMLVQNSLKDEYRGVHRKHLWLYLKEFEFRFSRRWQSQNTFRDMLSDFPSFEPTNLNALRRWNSYIETN